MKVEDAIKLLKETSENNFLEIRMPESEDIVKFKELSSQKYQELSKMGFLDNEQLPSKLTELISELGQIEGDNLTEYKKICLLMLLKGNNKLSEKLKYSFNCKNELCEEVITDEFDLNDIYKEREFGNNSYEFKDGDIKIKIELKESSVTENAAFEVYVKNQTASLKTEKEKDLYNLYVNTYERYMLYIDKISINDSVVEDYKSMGMKERMKFLSSFSHNIINIEMIEEYSKNSFNNLITNVKCKACDTENKNLMHYTDFLLI